MIKIGDKIRIKPFHVCQNESKHIDYIPFGYNHNMYKYFGAIVTISDTEENPKDHTVVKCRILEDGGRYMWHPSLFEKNRDMTQQVFDVLMDRMIELNLSK